MRIKKFFIALLFLSISSMLPAQESAIYRDYQKTYKRGIHFYGQQLYGQALEEFDKVVRSEPLFQGTGVPMYIIESELYAGLSALYLGQADAEKRLLYFMEKNEPSSIVAKAGLALGDYYYAQRDYNQAIKYLSQVSDSELTNEEIIKKKFKLGYCYFVKKKFNKAKVLLVQIKAAKTKYYYPSNYYYGIIEFFDKNYDKALEAFQRVNQSSRYDKVVPSYIIQIYFAKKEYREVIKYGKPLIKKKNIRERKQVTQLIGQSYFELGEYQKALPLLEQYVSRTPKVSKEALYQLGYTQYKTGKHREAIKHFKQLNGEKNPLGQNALYNMADCLLKIKNKSAARQAFQKASQMSFDPDLQEDALINYAKLSYELGFDSEAITALQSIQPTSDYNNEAQNLMAKVFLNTRNYDKALEMLRKMTPTTKTVKMKETHQKVAYFRGVQMYNNGKYDESIGLFDESLREGVNMETKALAYFWKGEAFFKKGSFDTSIDEYSKFVAVEETIQRLPDNSSLGVAYYGMGYSYINKNDYPNASKNFNLTVETIEANLRNYNDKYVINFVYPDALLRAGDCLLYLRNYSSARKYYNRIIKNNYPNKDYAMYQLSLIHNLENNTTSQLALLDNIIRNYPSSRYADDAYYDKGNALFNMNKKDLAIVAYEKLLQDYPNSDMKNRTLLKLGLIAYSVGRNEEALNYYKGVFRTDPQSEEAKDALAAIKEIYIGDGNPDGYFNFVNTVQGYSLGEFERDSLMFIAAQIKFNKADWNGAVASYTNYLDRFPTGLNSIQAHFNRGEALFDLKRYDEAIQDYAYISDQGSSMFAETANHRAANIAYYSTQNFSEAQKYYGRLEQSATTEELLFEAQQYGMRSAFYASDFQNLPLVAERLIKNARATRPDHAEAYYFMGKAYLAQEDDSRALDAFEQNIQLSGDDVHSAEARYWRAYLTYKNRNLDKAMELCFQNNKEIPAHPYWLVKSFILLADIYAEQDNLFQSKATLQSIVDNYEGDQDLLNEAKRKLQRVIDAEQSKSKIKRSNLNGELEMIEEK